jgi:hypothetical protein
MLLNDRNATEPWRDPIVEEIHRIREEYAASFNYDMEAMFRDMQKKQQEGGRKIVSFCHEKISSET